MSDQNKTKAQLIEELRRLRHWESRLHELLEEDETAKVGLSQERLLLEGLLDNTPDHIYFKDAESRFILISKALADWFGLSDPAEAIGKTDFDFFAEEHARPAYEDEQEIIRTGNPIEKEEKETWPDGRETWVSTINVPLRDKEGNIVGTFGISRDVTERKRAEAELAEERDLLRTLIDNLTEYYVFAKDAEGRFVVGNIALARHMGAATPDDLIGKTDFDFYPQELAAQFYADEQALLQSGQSMLDHEEATRGPDGNPRWTLTTKVLLHDSRGEVTGLAGVSREITERKQAESVLAQQAEQLARSNAELEQFAYIASHDLKEPLRKVAAFGDRLKAKYADALDERGLDYLARMQDAAARMQNLIDALLTYSRVTTKAQPFASVDLKRVVQEVTSDLEVCIQQVGGRVEVGDIPCIEADPTQMRQLLQNLIGNALKFHKPGEPPMVKVEAQLLNGTQPSSDDSSAATFCRLTVQDNGIGFDEQHLERIFQVFQRLHGRGEYEGTGIGLATCRKIVERHGGEITARSAPGEGATFIVTLPVAQSVEGQVNG